MGILNKLFGNNNKIRVQFIDINSNQTIGVSNMSAEQLPDTFSVDTTMHIGNEDWTVLEAIPENAADFVISKQLILKMRKVEYVDPKDLLYTLPTIANELPPTDTSPIFHDFEQEILEDDWRQNEFLNIHSLSLAELEIAKIKDIWAEHKIELNTSFNAFGKCYARVNIGMPNLTLDFIKLKMILLADKTGSLKINGVFVKNGFAIKLDNTIFYGILENNLVTQFCVLFSTQEAYAHIQNVLKSFNLIFVNWYNAEIISSNA